VVKSQVVCPICGHDRLIGTGRFSVRKVDCYLDVRILIRYVEQTGGFARRF
jgi:hypothetical protein